MEFQLCHKLMNFIEMKLKITWKLLYIGYNGYDNIKSQIVIKDIYEYGYCLLKDKYYNNELVAQLLGEKEDEYEFNRILEKLANNEQSEYQLQIRKWNVYLVKNLIENFNGDYVNEISEMNELWILLGQPEDSPHIYQSVRNNIKPQEYYTKKMYNILINRYKKWIDKEIIEINKSEINM